MALILGKSHLYRNPIRIVYPELVIILENKSALSEKGRQFAEKFIIERFNNSWLSFVNKIAEDLIYSQCKIRIQINQLSVEYAWKITHLVC